MPFPVARIVLEIGTGCPHMGADGGGIDAAACVAVATRPVGIFLPKGVHTECMAFVLPCEPDFTSQQ